MIYLPHPSFNFEDKEIRGGGIVGTCSGAVKPAYLYGFLGNPINADEVIKRFPKAKSDYWENCKCSGPSYCFVREDGAEFAIRFLKNGGQKKFGDSYGDVIGYWKDLHGLDNSNFILFTECEKAQYLEFVEYLLK